MVDFVHTLRVGFEQRMMTTQLSSLLAVCGHVYALLYTLSTKEVQSLNCFCSKVATRHLGVNTEEPRAWLKLSAASCCIRGTDARGQIAL